jgi:hypothetical protein
LEAGELSGREGEPELHETLVREIVINDEDSQTTSATSLNVGKSKFFNSSSVRDDLKQEKNSLRSGHWINVWSRFSNAIHVTDLKSWKKGRIR